MGITVTNEHVIELKAHRFKLQSFAGLGLSDTQTAAMALLCDQNTSELLFGGAAGGGKSFLGCEWLLWSCMAYPGTKWFIGRHHLTEIRESTIPTMMKVFAKHRIEAAMWKYNDQSVKIVFANGSVIKGIELMHKPGDPEFDSFGSTEYTGGWIEEGGGVAYKAKEVASTRIGRHYNDRYSIKGKLLITGNPSKNWMYSQFYKPNRDGSIEAGRVFLRSLVSDNPYREAGYEERLSRLEGATRARLYLGDWEFQDDPFALIDPEAIQDLFTNDFVQPDPMDKCLVIDVAMHGGDFLRAGVFYGDVLEEQAAMPKSGGAQVLALANRLRTKHQIPASKIIYDADGVGAFLGGDGGFIPGAIPFHGNAAPFVANKNEVKRDEDRGQKAVSEYANLKAQCGYLLAYDINEGKMWAKAVTAPEDQETLSEELGWIKAGKIDSDQKLRLMSKEQVIKGLGRSPDYSDLFLMKKYFDLKRATAKKKFNRPVRLMG